MGRGVFVFARKARVILVGLRRKSGERDAMGLVSLVRCVNSAE